MYNKKNFPGEFPAQNFGLFEKIQKVRMFKGQTITSDRTSQAPRSNSQKQQWIFILLTMQYHMDSASKDKFTGDHT